LHQGKEKKASAPVEEAGALHGAAEALRVADAMRRQLQQRPQQQQMRQYLYVCASFFFKKKHANCAALRRQLQQQLQQRPQQLRPCLHFLCQ
jgi:hypothetical protein